jgi:hypothetical protein
MWNGWKNVYDSAFSSTRAAKPLHDCAWYFGQEFGED